MTRLETLATQASFPRSHAHENAKTMEIRYHPWQGMGCIIYEIIISVLSHKNDQRAFSKKLRSADCFRKPFCCPKTPFTCERRTKICDFKNVRIHEDWALSWYFVFCDCPFNVIAKHTLLCLFLFCSLSCYCFFVILTSFFINFLLPRVLHIEIHNKLLITLYLIPSKSVAEELSFKFGPEALDFWSTNSVVRTGATVQHNKQYHNTEKYCSVAFI